MLSDDSILVLTTREKSWWWSMQEVIPAVERIWTGIGQSSQENIHMLCVPLSVEIKQQLQTFASKLKRIVITAVTPETVKIALLLRSQIKVTAPMIIYVFGDSTEGFHAFGALTDVLTERDVLVVSSEAEAKATRCSFPNAEIRIIPIPLVDHFKMNGADRNIRLESARLAYVGRVSEQKNLHTLLFALWILRTLYDRLPEITLEVYGGEDNLGSPNMGLKYADYGTYLQGLAEFLGLDDMVTWHGFKPRDWLFDEVHLKPHILVSATLHSDENFGSSVLASLVNGHQVVATAWGGHLDFQEWFSHQLTLVPVHRSTMGPVVNPFLLANSIMRAINKISTVAVKDTALDRARAEFSESTVTAGTLKIIKWSGGKSIPLKKSMIQHDLDERRIIFGGTRRIYESYEDPIAQIFFETYGMKEPLRFQTQSAYILAPWAFCSDKQLFIVDPHRGNQVFSLDAPNFTLMDIMLCPSMKTYRLPESVVRILVAQGYAFPFPPDAVENGRFQKNDGMEFDEQAPHR